MSYDIEIALRYFAEVLGEILILLVDYFLKGFTVTVGIVMALKLMRLL